MKNMHPDFSSRPTNLLSPLLAQISSKIMELQERNDKLKKENSSLIAELQKRNDIEKENTSSIAELQKRNDELEKENASLWARLDEMQREINQATFPSTEKEALHKKIAELTDINLSLQREKDEAIQAQEQLTEARLAHTNINRGMSLFPNFLHFDLAELKEATNDFAQEMEIGRGGFGKVYKGKLLHTTVAVKRLNPEITDAGTFHQEVKTSAYQCLPFSNCWARERFSIFISTVETTVEPVTMTNLW